MSNVNWTHSLKVAMVNAFHCATGSFQGSSLFIYFYSKQLTNTYTCLKLKMPHFKFFEAFYFHETIFYCQILF